MVDLNIEIPEKTQIVTKLLPLSAGPIHQVHIPYGAKLLQAKAKSSLVEIVFSVNPNRKVEPRDFIFHKEGDFLPVGKWRYITLYKCEFSNKKLHLLEKTS